MLNLVENIALKENCHTEWITLLTKNWHFVQREAHSFPEAGLTSLTLNYQICYWPNLCCKL